MVDEIERRVYDLVRPFVGVSLFNNKKKQPVLTVDTDFDTDLKLDIGESEDLMDKFFAEFKLDRGRFDIETYYADVPVSLNPLKKVVPVQVPDFTIGMLVESAKAG